MPQDGARGGSGARTVGARGGSRLKCKPRSRRGRAGIESGAAFQHQFHCGSAATGDEQHARTHR